MKNPCRTAVPPARPAGAGPWAVVVVSPRRREKELDEYERLLFGEDEAVPADTEDEGDAGDAEAAGEDAAEE